MSDCVFCDILNGTAEGEFIMRDDERQFAIIRNIHPEGGIHWLALPYEHHDATETLERLDSERFVGLMQFATAAARSQIADYPDLTKGFTLKFHVGSFETLPHAKLHILSVE